MKKHSLSLKKPITPSDIEEEELQISSEKIDIVNLCSDDDEDFKLLNTVECVLNSTQTSSGGESAISVSSQTTVIYDDQSEIFEGTFVTSRKSPTTPKKKFTTPHSTPKRLFLTPKTSNSVSPGSRSKYYSPTKKRAIVKRSPVKRKLDQDFAQATTDHGYYIQACEGMDDKTVFLLDIIHTYLENKFLKRLLSEECQLLLTGCMDIRKPGMMVVCRLYWWKEGWYRIEKIKQMVGKVKALEESDFQDMINSLITSGLLEPSTSGETNLSFEDFTLILNADELKQICKVLKLKMKTKQDAVDALRSFSRKQAISNYFTGNSNTNYRRVVEIMRKKAGICYKLSELARTTFYRLYVLMYLGIDYSHIRDKKLELLLINNKIKRETYPVDRDMPLDDASVVFESKEQFDSYMTAHYIYEEYLEKTDLNEKCAIVSLAFISYKSFSEEEILRYKSLPPWLRRFTPSDIYVKILDTGIHELKKHKTTENYQLAVEILDLLIAQIAFRQHKKAEWYTEKALILHYLGQTDEAAKVLLEGFNSDLSEDAKDSLRPRAKKIASQASQQLKIDLLQHTNKENTLENKLPGKHIYKQPMERFQQYGKLKFETRVGDEMVVQDAEEYCISHYINSGKFTDGKHWEGKFIITIFFLLFWDIIYTKPRGVIGIFLSRFQLYPLDMFTESFYINRKTLIDERLAVIKRSTTEEMIEMMHRTWSSRPECEMSGIPLPLSEWSCVAAAARAVRAPATAALCARLAAHYRYWCAGYPDLTLWDVHTAQIKFVEVKTDTDKPSMKQLQWMHYMKENGIDTEFCYVGINTTRTKSRAS
ncbi:fanconi-associated nuclease 1 [Aphomia sociella]